MLKFTKNDGDFYKLKKYINEHNHELETPVLDPLILKELDSYISTDLRPAYIKKLIT
jgi:hypothetical protein